MPALFTPQPLDGGATYTYRVAIFAGKFLQKPDMWKSPSGQQELPRMDWKRWCLEEASLLLSSPRSRTLEGLHLFSPRGSRSEGIVLYR